MRWACRSMGPSSARNAGWFSSKKSLLRDPRPSGQTRLDYSNEHCGSLADRVRTRIGLVTPRKDTMFVGESSPSEAFISHQRTNHVGDHKSQRSHIDVSSLKNEPSTTTPPQRRIRSYMIHHWPCPVCFERTWGVPNRMVVHVSPASMTLKTWSPITFSDKPFPVPQSESR